MRTVLVVIALLIGCTEEATRDDPAIVIQDPTEVAGKWCNQDLCLQVQTTGYGHDWFLYSWESSNCSEAGFIQVDESGQLLFGALELDRTGCFSQLSNNRYSVELTRVNEYEIAVQLSVLDHQLYLKEQVQ